MRAKLVNPETSRKGMKIFHNFQANTISVWSVQEIIRPQIVHDNDKLQPLTVLLVVQVLLYTSCISVHTNSQSPATHSQSTLHVQTPTLTIT